MTEPQSGAIREAEQQIVDLTAAWREAPVRTPSPVLYVHGVPTDGADWVPFLERTGGYAPDLPGFGRSGKPSHFPYTVEGYAEFLRDFLGAVGITGPVSLVVHDWGSVGLGLAQQLPDRIDRLVVMNAVPLLPGYRWHRIARAWRTPLVGEMAMGFTTKWGLRRSIGRAAPAAPEDFVDRIWSHFDHGTQRAILKLYRSAPPSTLAALGSGLDQIGSPSLVVWGERDPFIPLIFAQEYARRLGDSARLELIEGAGHWPWFDRPEVVDLVTGFLAGG